MAERIAKLAAVAAFEASVAPKISFRRSRRAGLKTKVRTTSPEFVFYQQFDEDRVILSGSAGLTDQCIEHFRSFCAYLEKQSYCTTLSLSLRDLHCHKNFLSQKTRVWRASKKQLQQRRIPRFNGKV